VTASFGCMAVPLFSAKPFTYFHILSRLSLLGSAILSPALQLPGESLLVRHRSLPAAKTQFTSEIVSFTIHNFPQSGLWNYGVWALL